MEPRSAKDVIDQAILENRFSEWILYAFAYIFALVGLGILSWGIAHNEPIATVAGLVSSSLFWPAMSSARRTRKENTAIRLLEAPLSRADTAKEAAEMLRSLVDDTLRDNRNDG